MSAAETLFTSSDDDRRAKLKQALIHWRSRLTPSDVGLPSTSRRRVVGLRREEIAELVGVSSDWYRWFESGRPIRVSVDFVCRVAEALLLDPDERVTLFSLALPEIAAAVEPSLHAQSAALLNAISGLRRFVRRAWSAGSVTEILTRLTETVAEHFKDGEMFGVYRRMQPGLWEYPVIEVRRLPTRAADIHFRLREGLTPEQIDESMLHSTLRGAGDVGTLRESLRSTRVKRHFKSALAAEGFNNADCLAARIDAGNGRNGTVFVAHLDKPKVFSELDRSLLAALADVASLALRGSNSERDGR